MVEAGIGALEVGDLVEIILEPNIPASVVREVVPAEKVFKGSLAQGVAVCVNGKWFHEGCVSFAGFSSDKAVQMKQTLAEIKEIVYMLDCREGGTLSAGEVVKRVQGLLNKPWTQNEEQGENAS